MTPQVVIALEWNPLQVACIVVRVRKTMHRNMHSMRSAWLTRPVVWGMQGLSMLLWAFGKTIPPSAEAAVLLSTISDQVLRKISVHVRPAHWT